MIDPLAAAVAIGLLGPVLAGPLVAYGLGLVPPARRRTTEWLIMYDIDPPYNCFPSLHVAYAFVSALACSRVHRGVGRAGGGVGSVDQCLHALYQAHYVLDVIAGIAAAALGYALFLRRHPRDAVPEADRRRAPRRAAAAVLVFGIMMAGFWAAYLLR